MINENNELITEEQSILKEYQSVLQEILGQPEIKDQEKDNSVI